jgi:alanine dehydrogenase
MIVGILKEIKTEENRVSMTPAGIDVMRDNGVIHYCVICRAPSPRPQRWP